VTVTLINIFVFDTLPFKHLLFVKKQKFEVTVTYSLFDLQSAGGAGTSYIC